MASLLSVHPQDTQLISKNTIRKLRSTIRIGEEILSECKSRRDESKIDVAKELDPSKLPPEELEADPKVMPGFFTSIQNSPQDQTEPLKYKAKVMELSESMLPLAHVALVVYEEYHNLQENAEKNGSLAEWETSSDQLLLSEFATGLNNAILDRMREIQAIEAAFA